MEVRTLKAMSKETKQPICRVEPQGLLNLTRKKNDEKKKDNLNKLNDVGVIYNKRK
jgi:hypothetical protein